MDSVRTAELFSPATYGHCQLPELPDVRQDHTADGGLVCGGSATLHSCRQFSSSTGSWDAAHAITGWRAYHSSWEGEEGGILMGGDVYPRTTEIVKHHTVEEAFPLIMDTKYPYPYSIQRNPENFTLLLLIMA